MRRRGKIFALGGAVITGFLVVPLVLLGALVVVLGGWLGNQSSSCIDMSRSIAEKLALGTPSNAVELYFGQFAPADRAEREKNASIIISVGRARKLTNRTIAIAVATAIQESGLRNLPYGDRDSLGLFQQRPSQGWGTPEQILNPEYAAGKFYDALVKIPDRDQRPMIDVAMQVQRPDPFFYRRDWKWDTIATDLVNGAVGGSGQSAQPDVSLASQCQEPAAATNLQNASRTGWFYPIKQGSYTKTSPFGMRYDPATGQQVLHNGVDLAAPAGTPIYSVTGGVVTSTAYQTDGGNVTWIKTADNITIGYAHQQSRAGNVQVGATIAAGELIGYVGTTGQSTGPHLHFYIMTNSGSGVSFVEPEAFMRERGIVL